MKKYILTFFTLVLFFNSAFCQDENVKEDLIAPSPGSGENALNGNVNLSNGKLNLPITITTLNSRTASYPLTINYNGQKAIKEGQNLNKYNPTGPFGVGWSMNVPKIVADTKQTATRHDDEFYLQGSLNSKLICYNLTEPSQFQTGTAYWEFKTEQLSPSKIKYYLYNRDREFINGVLTYVDYPLDYWEIIDENGVKHIYGKTDNSRESVLAWGNWIGDSSNPTGAEKHTIVWNILEIEDQWNDKITFNYQKVEKQIASTGPTHTEASYLKEIISSTNERIELLYAEKVIDEYYEPHKEGNEPDAYQERYEKKHINEIKTYDRDNQLVYTYRLLFDRKLYPQNNAKRFLESITQKDKNGISLPSQKFEYHHTGDFKGCIKKNIMPEGGYIEYNYLKKQVFTNNNSSITNGNTHPDINTRAALYVSDNYSLRLMYDGPFYQPTGSFPFKIQRSIWDGKKWIITERKFDENIKFYEYGANRYLDNARFVFGENFYATLIFNRDTDKGNLYISYKNKDNNWVELKINNINVESWDDDHKEEDPVLISGEDFIAIGTNRSGRLHKYFFNGYNWIHSETSLGYGQYYYEAINNYILILDEDGTTDVVTGSSSHPDNYYINYLDNEKKWNLKSWSSQMDNTPYVNSIEKPSFFYPNNSMSAFVADDNPEFFLRWDKNYDLTNIDNVVGQLDDSWPMIPVGNNMFTSHELLNFGTLKPKKTFVFNGQFWVSKTMNAQQGGGLFFNQLTYRENNIPKLARYNPNTNSWMNDVNLTNPQTLGTSFIFSSELFLAKNYLYKINNDGFVFVTQASNAQINKFANTGGGNYIYAEFSDNGTIVRDSYLYYIDKQTGNLQSKLILNNESPLPTNKKAKGFGGNRPLHSKYTLVGSNLLFKRLIDNDFNQVVYDIVVSSIESNNNEGSKIITEFQYNNPMPNHNNSSTLYEEVITENKGNGNGDQGKIVNKYYTEEDNINLLGILKETSMFNSSNEIVKKTVYNYGVSKENIFNSSLTLIGKEFYVRNNSTIEEVYFSNDKIRTQTFFEYNDIGLLLSKSYNNSQGIEEKEVIEYAYDQYSFIEDANLLKLINKKTNFIGGNMHSYKKSNWEPQGDKVCLKEVISGSSESTSRKDQIITLVDNFGNILESHNNSGLTTSILMGYNYTDQVASILNATNQEVLNQLDVSYANLQTLTNSQLETELIKLYDRIPDARISINLYDNLGRIVKSIDERENSIQYNYDTFGRLLSIRDKNGNLIESKVYNYKN